MDYVEVEILHVVLWSLFCGLMLGLEGHCIEAATLRLPYCPIWPVLYYQADRQTARQGSFGM